MALYRQIKLFKSNYINTLEKEVNDFCKKIKENLVDVKIIVTSQETEDYPPEYLVTVTYFVREE